MRINKDIRRLAFQTLYQLDARNGEHRDEVRAQLATGWKLEAAEEDSVDTKAIDAAWMLAEGAWEHRQSADEELALLAPDWPTSRLAAVDRAILRLAHFEMSAGASLGTPPKVAVNDAINLAKEFSTDRAPAFINGLLDKVLRRVLGEEAAVGDASAEPDVEPEVEPISARSVGEEEPRS